MTIRELCEQYAAWCEEQGLPAVSAHELAVEDDITPEQRKWLYDFLERWRDAVDAEANMT